MELAMVTEFGIYVDGVWCVWIPAAQTLTHGWKSAEEATRFWRHPDREHKFVPYLNGKESPWGMNTGGVQVDGVWHSGPIMQRVWFEGGNEQLAFDLEAMVGVPA